MSADVEQGLIWGLNPKGIKVLEFICAYLGCVLCQGCHCGQKALEGRWVRGMAKTGKNAWCYFSLRTNRKKSKLETHLSILKLLHVQDKPRLYFLIRAVFAWKAEIGRTQNRPPQNLYLTFGVCVCKQHHELQTKTLFSPVYVGRVHRAYIQVTLGGKDE